MTQVSTAEQLNLPAPIDSRELRHTFGTFATGVTVVTTRTPDGVPHGATVNAFTAVSLEPPLAQVTLTRSSKAAQYLDGAPFAINILSAAQQDVALHFAGKPMQGAPEWVLDGGVPVLCGNAGTLECCPWNVYDGGDHIIVIGEVVSLEYDRTAEPLVFYGGKFRAMGELIDGAPWNLSGDGPDSGWFAGSRSFKALYSR
jgi:flavin reductase (DIM6/NTAB) family NADH-FMN oxidoreductase RutF